MSLLNGLRRDLADNNVSTWEEKAPVGLSPTERRDLIENVRELAQTEMRNAFVIVKEPGYADRQIFDPNAVLAKIRAISAPVADEIATRYATAKIYRTASVAAGYSKLEKELLASGSEADVSGIAADAEADGYEFGGDRVKKQVKRRVQIPPAMMQKP